MDDDGPYRGRHDRYYGPLPDGTIAIPDNIRGKRKLKKHPPQESVKQFWDKFNTKYPGKVFTILPANPLVRKKASKTPKGAVQQRAAKSYEMARAECERDVQRIVRECRRVNQKYRDPH